jgi:hypothetical protein
MEEEEEDMALKHTALRSTRVLHGLHWRQGIEPQLVYSELSLKGIKHRLRELDMRVHTD